MNQFQAEDRYINNSLSKKIAFYFFILFLFFLPLYEAPKNIFSVLFVFLGGWVAFSRENAAQRFKSKDPVTWAFSLLAISPFVAGMTSQYMDFSDRFSSASNWALMPLVALALILTKFSEGQLVWALRVFCVGTVAATGEAFYSWSGVYPELNSVGHVNQSALYLAFCIIPAMLLFMSRYHIADLFLALAVILAVICYQGPASSIIGFGTSLFLIAGLWVIYCFNRRRYKLLTTSIVSGVILGAIFLSLPQQHLGSYKRLKHEIDYRLRSPDHYSQRDRLINTALEIAGRSIAGFGLGSFGVASDLSKIKEVVEAKGEAWTDVKGKYASSSHGHNLFANILVERGWIGVVSCAVFFWILLIKFSHNLRRERSQIGVLTLTAIVGAGLGQSTLHVEHGQLAFICLALCLSMAEESNIKIDLE